MAPGDTRLAACQQGKWAQFVKTIAPARPLLAGRIDHHRCLTTTLTVVPLWGCSTEDAESADWVAVHGVAETGKPMWVREVAPFSKPTRDAVRADEVWPLRLRAGAFAVLDLRLDEVLSVEGPMFASWFEPRVLLAGELEAQVRALCFTAEDSPE